MVFPFERSGDLMTVTRPVSGQRRLVRPSGYCSRHDGRRYPPRWRHGSLVSAPPEQQLRTAPSVRNGWRPPGNRGGIGRNSGRPDLTVSGSTGNGQLNWDDYRTDLDAISFVLTSARQ